MPFSAGEYLRAVEFWRMLSAKQKVSFVEATQMPPLDPHGGLWDLHNTLWRSQKKSKLLLFTILIFRGVLNTWTTLNSGAQVWAILPSLSTHIDADSIPSIVLGKKGCSEVEIVPNKSPWYEVVHFTWCEEYTDVKPTQGTLVSDGRRTKTPWECPAPGFWSSSSTAWCKTGRNLRRTGQGMYMTSLCAGLVEQIFIISYACQFLFGLVVWVCLGSAKGLTRWPAVFLESPRRLATFSTLKLIRYLNPNIGKRLPHILMQKTVMLFGSNAARLRASRYHSLVAVIEVLAVIIVALSAIFMSFSAAWLKLTALWFVAIEDPSNWSSAQMAQLFGFLNQLAGIIDIDGVEMDRLFLFRYGGSDSSWQIKEHLKVRAYIEMFLTKMTTGKFGRAFKERLEGWLCLAVFNSKDLQKLWMREDVETDLDDPKHVAAEVLNLNKRLDPLYWPPWGSDDSFQKKPKDQGVHPLENVSPGHDMRLSYFLENMQSYRIWLTKNCHDPPWLFNAQGELKRGDAALAVDPQISLIKEDITKLLANPGHHSLQLASKLQAEVEDLEQMGERSQSLRKKNTDTKPRATTAEELDEEAIPRWVIERQTVIRGKSNSTVGHDGRSDSFLEEGPQAMKISHLEVLLHELPGVTQEDLPPEGESGDPLPSHASESSSFGRPAPRKLGMWALRFITAMKSPTCPKRRRDAILEVYLALIGVFCNTPKQLEAAFQDLGLPRSLASARQVVLLREQVLNEVKKVKEQVSDYLKDIDIGEVEYDAEEAQKLSELGWKWVGKLRSPLMKGSDSQTGPLGDLLSILRSLNRKQWRHKLFFWRHAGNRSGNEAGTRGRTSSSKGWKSFKSEASHRLPSLKEVDEPPAVEVEMAEPNLSSSAGSNAKLLQ